MADGTKIEWTDATWNIVNGCSVLTPGCTNCYAMKLAGTRLKHVDSRVGLTIDTKAGPVWNGTTKFNDKVLLDPIRWKRPRKIFVCAHGDLFHDSVPDEWIGRVFAVMALAPHHVFQVLTKRSARMREYATAFENRPDAFGEALAHLVRAAGLSKQAGFDLIDDMVWPLPNVWLGVSVEDQQRADERIPDLLATPAAVRWLSCEPLLGPVDLTSISTMRWRGAEVLNALTGGLEGMFGEPCATRLPAIDWVVAGGENGPRAMHPDWVRALRDKAASAGVAFLFKQWGTHAWAERVEGDPTTLTAYRAGKKAAGRLLDGVEHNGYPS